MTENIDQRAKRMQHERQERYLRGEQAHVTPSRPTSGEAALRTAARKLLDLWGLEGMSAAADTLEDVLAATPTTTPSVRERRYEGPVVIIECEDDPGDMGEPREFSADGVDYLCVPSWAATPTPTPGLDVERLARAMNTDGGDPPLWDILGERTREQYRAKARVIAAEYDRLSR